jgi:hypothetical protein
MPRNKGVGLLIVIMVVGILAATVLSEILLQLAGPSNVVHRVLLQSFEYNVGPLSFDLVMASFTFGFDVKVNLLTALALPASFYFWKYRT